MKLNSKQKSAKTTPTKENAVYIEARGRATVSMLMIGSPSVGVPAEEEIKKSHESQSTKSLPYLATAGFLQASRQ